MSGWSYGRYASQASQQRTCRVGRFISLEQAEREKCSLSRVGDEIGLEQFGATIMASPDLDRPSEDQRIVVRLSHVEVRPRTIRRVDSSTRVSLQMFNVGQAFRRNRYPIKLNYNGNTSRTSNPVPFIHHRIKPSISRPRTASPLKTMSSITSCRSSLSIPVLM